MSKSDPLENVLQRQSLRSVTDLYYSIVKETAREKDNVEAGFLLLAPKSIQES